MLDSDKSGGLDSQEFCSAIRKLVRARALCVLTGGSSAERLRGDYLYGGYLGLQDG